MAQTMQIRAGGASSAGAVTKIAAFGGLMGGVFFGAWMMIYEGVRGLGWTSMFNVCYASFVFRSQPLAMAGMSHSMASSPDHAAGAMGSTHHAMGSSSAMTHTESSGGAMASTHHAMGSSSAMTHPESSAGAMGSTHHAMGSSGAGHAMTTMSAPASHTIVGILLHLGFSAAVGVAFAWILLTAARVGIPWINRPAALVLASMAGASLLYVIMIYGLLPHINTVIVDFTPRGAFFVAHLLFGATFGLVLARWLPNHSGVTRSASLQLEAAG